MAATTTLTENTTWEKAVVKDAADVTNIGSYTLTIGNRSSGTAVTSDRQFGTLNIGENGTLKMWSNTQNYGTIATAKPAASATSIDTIVSTINMENGSRIYAEDGSYYFANVVLAAGASAMYENQWRKAAVFDALTVDENSTFTIQQNNSSDSGTTYVSLIRDNAETLKGTVKLVDNASSINLQLAIANSNALASAKLDSGNNNKCEVALKNNTVNLRSLTGSGKVMLAANQGVSTLNITGTDNETFSGTIDSGVKFTIASGAKQTISGATIAASSIVNNGTLTIEGTNTVTLNVNNIGELLLWSNRDKYVTDIHTGQPFAKYNQNATINLISGSGTTDLSNATFALSTSTLSDGTALTINNQNGAISFDVSKVAFCGSSSTTMQYGSGATTNDVTDCTTIVFNGSGKLNVLSGANFDASTVAVYKDSVNRVTPYLTGAGTYTAKAGQGITNMNLDSAWTGKVVLSGDHNTALDLNSVGRSGSTIQLNGVMGSLAAANTVAADINLTNNGRAAADFTQIAGNSYTFTGAVSGTGNFVINQSGKTVDLTFSGNVYSWANTGNADAYTGMRVANGTANVTFSGDNTNNVRVALNADSKSGAVGSGTLNVIVDRNATFTNIVNVNSIRINAGKTVTFQNGTVNTDAITVEAGASLNLSAQASRNVGSVTLNGGTLTLGNHSVNLTTTDLTVSAASTLNANLVVANNGTLAFSSGALLTMGCDVTIDGDVVTVMIDRSELASIMNGQELTLITNINQLTLNDNIDVHFKDANDQSLDGYGLRLDRGKDGISLVVTPEPATATLSLLALAAICARRKRR